MVRTLRETKLGEARLRLVEKANAYVGLVISDGNIQKEIVGDNADDVWRQLHDEAAKANPKFVGFDGARRRFLSFFPGGFNSAEYLSAERDYKIAAKARLDEGAPLKDALNGAGFGDVVLSVFRSTNLLSLFEKTRLRDALRGPGADSFVRGAAKFALGDLEIGLREMTQALKPHDVAKWTAVTYLPFLWRPSEHMFLKPKVTKDFAARVGHPFLHDYTPELSMGVYKSLLDLARQTEDATSDLQPQDRIDVQSFVWVAGEYKALVAGN